MTFTAAETRYDRMQYRNCGRSGLKLPLLSLGLWQNFGANRDYAGCVEILGRSFDAGITHFDLANNYGPPKGGAELFIGQALARDFHAYRDELVIATKAGFNMWPGPYGEFNSRKTLLASLDQSLRRMGLDYVDIFYSHRYDRSTPLEETMCALAQAVRQGKALYVAISSYPAEATREAHRLLAEMGVPVTLHQPSYSAINRWIERDGVVEACADLGIGIIAFSPLSQGVLTGKYGAGDISGSRRADPLSQIKDSYVEPRVLAAVEALRPIAAARGQSMVQLALAWVLSRPGIASALIGIRTVEQLNENLGALENLGFTTEETAAIDAATQDGRIDLFPTQKSWQS